MRNVKNKDRSFNRFKRSTVITCAVAVVIAAGITPGAQAATTQPAQPQLPLMLPKTTGPNPVGSQFMQFNDDGRVDVLAVNAGKPANTKRRFSAWIYYPAKASQACIVQPYLTKPVAEMMIKSGLREAALVNVMTQIATPACSGAPIADGKFPVVIFSHGYTGSAENYSAWLQEVASYGYVVINIAHTYESAAAMIDGKAVTLAPMVQEGERIVPAGLEKRLGKPLPMFYGYPEANARALPTRFADLAHVFFRTQPMNEKGFFAGHLDTDKIVFSGHSYGATASMWGQSHLYLNDGPKLAAVIALDGASESDIAVTYGGNKTKIPSLLFIEDDSVSSHLFYAMNCFYWQRILAGPRYMVRPKGASHHFFTDALPVAIALKDIPEAQKLALAHAGAITGDPEAAYRSFTSYYVGFLDRYTKNKTVAWLDDPQSKFPNLILDGRTDTPDVCTNRDVSNNPDGVMSLPKTGG